MSEPMTRAFRRRAAEPSVAKPMTVWCVLVFILIAIVIAIGAVLFVAPGGHSIVKKTGPPPALRK